MAQAEPSTVGAGVAALVIGLLVSLGAALALLVERRRARKRLDALRQRADAFEALLTASVWQSDAAHRWVRVPVELTGIAHIGSPVSASFGGAAAVVSDLQGRLDAQLPIRELVLADARGASFQPLRLSAQPLVDEQGVFRGYLGALRIDGSSLLETPDDPGRTAGDHEAFSYTVSHDLRAPLRIVTGFATILKEDSAHLLDRVGRDHLERVLGAAARMNRMIDALLALAQLSSQRVEHRCVDLSLLAELVLADLRQEHPSRAIDLRIEPGLSARGDPTLLRVLLENLLGNAWKYSAKRQQACIEFFSAQVDGRRVFTVRDNGAGFDMRVADRLFGAFQRLHSASDFAGHGVGLASAQRIVRRHGGEIWAESEVGAGARFSFTLGD